MSLKDEKNALRNQFREHRARFTKEGGAQATAAIHANLKRWLRDLAAQTQQVCAYRPVGDEVDPCIQPVTELFFPRVESPSLNFWRPSKPEAFDVSSFGISEPIPDLSAPFDPKAPSLVLCPATAVDSLGRRIGSGAGYYDRFFQATPKAVRVGVVFHIQVSQNPLPLEGWDQPLDWIITEKMILRVSRRSS